MSKEWGALTELIAHRHWRMDKSSSPAQNCTNLHVNHKASLALTPLTACEGRCSSRYWKQRRARNFQMLEANLETNAGWDRGDPSP